MPEESSEASSPPSNDATPAPVPAAAGESEDWATRYKYLYADFENFRRRTEKNREAIGRQARAGLVRELLPIFEAFRGAKAAVAHLPPSDPVRHGLELLDREWSTFLKREGVEPVAAVGEPFRPEEEEAVGEAPATTDHPEGTVLEIVQQGYRFYGGVLRPAKVVVARAATDAAAGDAREEAA